MKSSRCAVVLLCLVSVAACVGSDAQGPAGSTGKAGSSGQTGAGGTSTGAGGSGGIASGGGTAGAGGIVGTGGIPSSTGTGGGSARVDLTGKKALIVIDNPASPDDGDVVLQQTLQVRGMVATFGAVTGPASIATGQSVVIASSGATAADFATVFKDVPVPMLIFGNSHFQPLGLVPTGSANRGNASSSTQLTITDGATPLAASMPAGTSLLVISASRSTQLTWGIPGGAPIKVASVMGTPAQLCVFAFDKGAMTAMGVAAARRVALGWKTDVVQDLTVDGFKLLSAALDWTAGAP